MFSKFTTSTITLTVCILISLFLIKFFNIEYPIAVTSTNRSSELSVVGEGQIDVVPDTAYVDIGITVANAATVQDAQKQINDVNNNIINSMKNLGIDKANIRTSNYSISPNYRNENNTNTIDGYNGNATVSIKATDPQMVSKVIEQATASGANQVQGTRFVVANPEKYREEARAKAIQNAKDQANKLASDLGLHLGKITNIVESGNNPYPMMYADKSLAVSGMGGGPQVEPGTQTISSTVTLFFEKR